MLVTHLNFMTILKLSTNPRGSAPNGNIYFNNANGTMELITVEDGLVTIPGLGPNLFTDADGITMRAIYDFESYVRTLGNETQRNYLRYVSGKYRYAGAFNWVYGRHLATDADRKKIRGSGFIEYANTASGVDKNRIYHGVLSLNPIRPTTRPYWAIVPPGYTETTLQAATWTDFARTGDINEPVQVYGSTAFGDAGAGNFDNTLNTLLVRCRSWGYNSGETTSVASGVTEFSGNSAGYGVGETLNPQNTYPIASVYGGARITPWDGLTLVKLAAPQVETGFNESNGSFTWVLRNTKGASVQQCTAYLDAAELQDADIEGSAGFTYNGKKGRIWYTRNAEGKVVTSQELFIEGLSPSEKQNIIMTANDGSTKTYPYFPSCELNVGSAALTDPLAWYQLFYEGDGPGAAGDFNTATAETVKDASGIAVKGNVVAKAAGEKIIFTYGYDAESLAGRTNFNMVAVVEGDGVVAQAIKYFTMTRSPIVAVDCIPPVDTNA